MLAHKFFKADEVAGVLIQPQLEVAEVAILPLSGRKPTVYGGRNYFAPVAVAKVAQFSDEQSEGGIDGFADERDRLAIYKAFQEVGEACLDMISMMLGDEGKTPEDDYINISKLEKLGIITKEIKQCLIDLNGLRNRIVHEYNGLDDKIALDSMDDLAPAIRDFLFEVEKWIKGR